MIFELFWGVGHNDKGIGSTLPMVTGILFFGNMRERNSSAQQLSTEDEMWNERNFLCSEVKVHLVAYAML